MPPLSPETLLAHRQFLEGLSRALTSDPASADDLVQETWLAALQSPPGDRSTVRAWLARVMRNAAATERRSERRRRKREQEAAAGESLPSVAQIAEREAVARRVIDLVFDLEEPYASVVLHRFYDELPPREIARRQRVPVETVRTRLRRGLERLRARLDRSFGDRDSWTAAVVPLSGLSAGRLSPGAHGGGPSFGGPSVGGAPSPPVSGAETAAAGTKGGAFSWAGGGAGAGTGSCGVAGSGVASGIGKVIATGGIMTSVKVLGVSAAATLMAVFVTSAYVRSEADTEIMSLRSERDSLAGELARARDELSGLEEQLAGARSRANRLADRRRPPAPPDETEVAPTPAAGLQDPSPPGSRRHADPVFALGSLEEADAIVASLGEKGDIEGLWLLAFELLGHGEAGYGKVVEIAEKLEQDSDWVESFRALWHREEQIAGAFLRDTFDNAEKILRFGLYLEERARSGKVPSLLQDFRKNGGFFLSAYPGDAPEIFSDYTELYRRRLSGEIAPEDRQRSHAIGRDLQALSYIPTDEATDVILDVLDRSPPGDLRKVAVTALAWQRNPRALPKLRELLAIESDPKLAEVLDAAIRFIE